MQSAQEWQFDDFALVRRFHRARFRAVPLLKPVRAVMVIVQIARENPAQMFFVQHDDVVQAFPAEGTDKAFDHRILPRGARRNELLFQAQVLDSAHEIRAVNGIPIPKQITGGVVKGKASTICWAVQKAEGASVMLK